MESPMPDFSDRTLWRLILTVGMCGLEATFLNVKTHVCVPYLRRAWECPAPDVLENLEDAVYDDPLLPDDYNVSILISPRSTLLVPPESVDPEARPDIARVLDAVDASETKEVWTEPMGEALALCSLPKGIRGFLNRTFPTEDVRHLMAPIVEHFAPVARSEGGEKMWAHLHEGGVDMAAWRDGRLLHAGTWACKPGADAAYYLLFAWRALRLDSAQGELRVSGTELMRREVMTMLRHHINYVGLTVTDSATAVALSRGVALSQALVANNFSDVLKR